MKKAILIGAGFSYDLGFPLGKGLTKDLFSFFNKSKMDKFVSMWKKANPYGNDRPINESAFDTFLQLYSNFIETDMNNYEDFIKLLQKNERERGNNQDYRDTYNYILSKFNSILNEFFWIYQKENYNILEKNLDMYRWLLKEYSQNELWVLSLNHDVNIELMCIENKIPFTFGTKEEIQFPINNIELSNKISLLMHDRVKMKLNDMNFYKNEKGINLLKIHGGLNEFSFDDDKRILFIDMEKCETPIDYLEKIDTVMHKMQYFINGNPIRDEYEIVISDNNKEMQFLTPSILSGGYKYSITLNPKEGEEKIQLFSEILNEVDELTIFGYGFGDRHINDRIYNAMLINNKLKIIIVDPYIKSIPENLKPFEYNMRIRLAKCTTAQWIGYLKDGVWDSEISERLKKMESIRLQVDRRLREKYFK
ncbi:hypothetical protein CDLVIII_3193 [Clostridium sp. DL-VIII]|uniref:hypothetical protein n=1 Tax=Clostridium sp. DL-VIII TaxID=641107 RepID=UPI00023AFFC6|nr:hypothetical protein [Clostridium sp. DL-VIII]EHI99767.1 hypothetical protein CDLVIII_3193 [Clostridium sp. DL-VIII]